MDQTRDADAESADQPRPPDTVARPDCAQDGDGAGASPLPPPTDAHMAAVAALQDGWYDGEGRAPARDCVGWAVSILRQLDQMGIVPEPPTLGPTPAGGIDLLWRSERLWCTVGPDLTLSIHKRLGSEVDATVYEELSLKGQSPQAVCAEIAKHLAGSVCQ